MKNKQIEEVIVRSVMILAFVGILIFLCTRGANSTKSVKTPPKKLKKQDTTQTVYVYPSGDKGTLRYDWKTGEKGTEINFE